MDASKISHYRVLEKLGAGGMGEVYLAEDMKLGRKVALKILGEEYTTNRDRLHRFEQEACAASALNHPNILTIYEVGNDDGKHYIATEYIDGPTLRQKMRGSSSEVGEILDVAVQVGSALEEAHAAGIIHRDIKPDNIMVRTNGLVKVLDFGLAKLTESQSDRGSTDGEASTRVLVQTDAGVVMGTSHYMSPEQTRAKSIDARTDIWSLGVVMYEMVTGRTPFDGETSTDVIVAITQKEAPPIARFAPNTPAELDWIISKALRKDRDERYQTIKELLTDLRRLKQKLDFEAELERSVAPDAVTRSTISGTHPVSTISLPTAATAGASAAHAQSSAEYIVSEIKRHKTGAGIALVLLVAAIGIGLFLYLRPAQALTDKDTIVLADFVNTTGDSVFDGTLKQALAVQLGQSPFLNIYPEERVREALRFMGRSPDDRVTKDIAREICERRGLKALLAGTISSLGNHYVVTLEAVNAHNGDTIAREQAEAESKEKVLSALGTAASRLRERLGESLASIKKYDVAIEQATTSSLEALKAFAMGNELRAKGDQHEAAGFYRRAIELDPNFAMAYARLAVYHGNNSELDQAQKYAQKAYELRDRVSDRERFYISEKYHNYITGDILKAVEVLKTWARTYPNDYIPHNNLANNHSFLGQREDALRESMEASRLDPANSTARGNVVDSFISLNRFEEAKQSLSEWAARNPEARGVKFYTIRLAFLDGDLGPLQKELQRSQGKPDEGEYLATMAAAMSFQGKLRSSQQYVERATSVYKSQNRTETVAQNMIGHGFDQGVVGNCEAAKASANSGLGLSKGRIEISTAAMVFAICKDVAKAEVTVAEMVKLYPEDTANVVMIQPAIRAEIERQRGNAAAAVQILEGARGYDLGLITGFWTTYFRGMAYLDAKRPNEAVQEFRKIIDNRGVGVFSVMYPLAHLGLARAMALAGDPSAGRKAYQDFFAMWKDADADLPVLVQAKKEYEQLK